MPIISTYGSINYPLKLGIYVYKGVDQGWSEFIGGQQLYNYLVYYSKINQSIQNNNLKLYLITFVIWIIILLILYILN